jgi:hypothetical protein
MGEAEGGGASRGSGRGSQGGAWRLHTCTKRIPLAC